MNNWVELLKHFVFGAINGFLFGISCELCLFLFHYIKAGSDLNQMPRIIYFEFPIIALFVVGIVKVIAYRVFRLQKDSIINWQIIGLLYLIAFIIYGQTRTFILNSFYEYNWGYKIYIGELIIGLIAVSLFNFCYSILKPKFVEMINLK